MSFYDVNLSRVIKKIIKFNFTQIYIIIADAI